MKFYLSSFKIWDNPSNLEELYPENWKAVYISNWLDFADSDKKEKHVDWDLEELK